MLLGHMVLDTYLAIMHAEGLDVCLSRGMPTLRTDRIWHGTDRHGNAIQVTRGAFCMPHRLHIWQRTEDHAEPDSVTGWLLIGDNYSQISAGIAL